MQMSVDRGVKTLLDMKQIKIRDTLDNFDLELIVKPILKFFEYYANDMDKYTYRPTFDLTPEEERMFNDFLVKVQEDAPEANVQLRHVISWAILYGGRDIPMPNDEGAVKAFGDYCRKKVMEKFGDFADVAAIPNMDGRNVTPEDVFDLVLHQFVYNKSSYIDMYLDGDKLG
jgi:hypothetical protein